MATFTKTGAGLLGANLALTIAGMWDVELNPLAWF